MKTNSTLSLRSVSLAMGCWLGSEYDLSPTLRNRDYKDPPIVYLFEEGNSDDGQQDQSALPLLQM